MTLTILLEPDIEIRHAWLHNILPNGFDMCISCRASCYKERREMLTRISALFFEQIRYNGLQW